MSTFKVDVDVPVAMRLRINGRAIVERAGRRIAKLIKQQLAEGVDGGGARLPTPKRGGRPLVKTGQLMRSIASDRARKGKDGGPIVAVRATGFHAARGEKKPKGRKKLSRFTARRGRKVERASNALILAAQAKRMQRQLLALTDAHAAEVAAAMRDELIAAINAGGVSVEMGGVRRLMSGGLF